MLDLRDDLDKMDDSKGFIYFVGRYGVLYFSGSFALILILLIIILKFLPNLEGPTTSESLDLLFLILGGGILMGSLLWFLKKRKNKLAREGKLKTWEEVRSKGKWNYLIQHGLRFGLIMIFLYHVLIPFLHGDQIRSFNIYSLIFPLGGIIMALFDWWSNERKYLKKING